MDFLALKVLAARVVQVHTEPLIARADKIMLAAKWDYQFVVYRMMISGTRCTRCVAIDLLPQHAGCELVNGAASTTDKLAVMEHKALFRMTARCHATCSNDNLPLS
jgi:hypothetical protein